MKPTIKQESARLKAMLAEDLPSVLVERQAWQYLANQWDQAAGKRNGEARTPDGDLGICHGIARFGEPLCHRMKHRMSLNTPPDVPVGASWWPSTTAGAVARAQYCRVMADACVQGDVTFQDNAIMQCTNSRCQRITSYGETRLRNFRQGRCGHCGYPLRFLRDNPL